MGERCVGHRGGGHVPLPLFLKIGKIYRLPPSPDFGHELMIIDSYLLPLIMTVVAKSIKNYQQFNTVQSILVYCINTPDTFDVLYIMY